MADEAPEYLYLCGRCRSRVLIVAGGPPYRLYEAGAQESECTWCRVVTDRITYKRIDEVQQPPGGGRVVAGRWMDDDDDEGSGAPRTPSSPLVAERFLEEDDE